MHPAMSTPATDATCQPEVLDRHAPDQAAPPRPRAGARPDRTPVTIGETHDEREQDSTSVKDPEQRYDRDVLAQLVRDRQEQPGATRRQQDHMILSPAPTGASLGTFDCARLGHVRQPNQPHRGPCTDERERDEQPRPYQRFARAASGTARRLRDTRAARRATRRSTRA